ncbi:hypothetical protein ACHHYP_17092 [Achlya hypogyna]|uniref:Uncharacterized protein n=1 Tax=Achlya hypogyna TaxID=1202772 RepID=A0A1V9Y583_ACHHY|nr:hypothetical protein ACHHYP_17092 [Achlya hypogyna]
MKTYVNYGRWTATEEQYLSHLIACFSRGILEENVSDTTLRQFLAAQLYCDPMRITKRLRKGRTLVNHYILANYNRMTYKRAGDYTHEDVYRLNNLKQTRVVFEASLRTKWFKTRRCGYLSMAELMTTDTDDARDMDTTFVN